MTVWYRSSWHFGRLLCRIGEADGTPDNRNRVLLHVDRFVAIRLLHVSRKRFRGS